MFLDKLISKLYMKRLVKRGLDLGEDVFIAKGVNIDATFPWLVHIGNGCDLAAWTYILAHDASSQHFCGKTKVGNVVLEENVFVGARTVILPNVRIGANSIIGSNSVVSKDIPPNVVAVGNPAKPVLSVDSFSRYHRKALKSGRFPSYDSSWTIAGGITEEMKKKMIEELGSTGGYID